MEQRKLKTKTNKPTKNKQANKNQNILFINWQKNEDNINVVSAWVYKNKEVCPCYFKYSWKILALLLRMASLPV